MEKRVVITGMGVAAPNGVGLRNFENALRQSKSGIKFLLCINIPDNLFVTLATRQEVDPLMVQHDS